MVEVLAAIVLVLLVAGFLRGVMDGVREASFARQIRAKERAKRGESSPGARMIGMLMLLVVLGAVIFATCDVLGRLFLR